MRNRFSLGVLQRVDANRIVIVHGSMDVYVVLQKRIVMAACVVFFPCKVALVVFLLKFLLKSVSKSVFSASAPRSGFGCANFHTVAQVLQYNRVLGHTLGKLSGTEVVLWSTLYYKACTKYFPVVLCTTRLAQSTSQYYFVLQCLHKVLPSTTLYYKACTKYISALPCTTKLAQSSLPSNTLCKPCSTR